MVPLTTNRTILGRCRIYCPRKGNLRSSFLFYPSSWHVLNADNIEKVKKDEKNHSRLSENSIRRKQESSKTERLRALRKRAGVVKDESERSTPVAVAKAAQPKSTCDILTKPINATVPDKPWYTQSRKSTLLETSTDEFIKGDPLLIFKKRKNK